jgi:hypothetical protein
VTKILRSDIQVTHLFLPFEEKKEWKENKTSFSSARDTKSQAIDIIFARFLDQQACGGLKKW